MHENHFESFDGNTEIERFRILNEAIIFRNQADCVCKLLKVESMKEDTYVRVIEEAIADLRIQYDF